ncbi:hypothetical protein GCM10028796_22790 [Ramlibacter monticola]|nr:hypothetical protein [Ramlibacter monticola]
MSRAMAVRALLVWLTILVLAVANGALREALLTPRLGRNTSLLLSGILLSALVLLVARISVGWLKADSANTSWRVGALWAGLTLVFEFGFGSLVQHKTGSEMLQPYLFRDGNIWPVVLVVILIAPRVCYRVR